MFAWFADPTAWISLATLTLMEVVLGIDNVVFISVLVSRLPEKMAKQARQIGLALALVFRIFLLFLLTWLIGLTATVVSGFGFELSWRDLILIAGGLFLFYKATHEIHAAIEEPHEIDAGKAAQMAFGAVVAQVVIIDAVFSVDSIVTAIGMAQHLEVMVLAVIIAVAIMYAASGTIADFISRHPTTKMLALSFLFLIGVTLVADGLGFHIPKGYVYFSMAFATLVEMFNVVARSRRQARKDK